MTEPTSTHWRRVTSRLDRVEQVAALDLQDPGLRAELDRLAQRTATATGHPVSMVNVLLTDAQATVGSHGLPALVAGIGGLPGEWSFCVQMVVTGTSLVVPDLAADPRFRGNPFVQMGLVRSYAGVPLTAADGTVLGGHCVLSDAAGACSSADLSALADGARQALALLEAHRRPPVTAG